MDSNPDNQPSGAPTPSDSTPPVGSEPSYQAQPVTPTASEPPVAPVEPTPSTTPEPSPLPPQNPAPSTLTTTPAPTMPSGPSGPAIVVGGDTSATETPLQPLQPFTGMSKPKRGLPKVPLLAGVAVLLIAGTAAAYQFGYKTNPSFVYSQSLKDTGKAYSALVDYAYDQSSAKYVGTTGSGSYSYKSGGTSTDGKMTFKSDGSNTDSTFDVGLGVSRANLEVMSIKSAGTSPDYYLKASGIGGLGSLIGPDEAGQLAKIDNKWIVVDHTLVDNLTQQLTQATPTTAPTKDQILDEAKAFGKVNQDYLFSTNPSKAVLKRTGTATKETVDGHHTIHYKVTLVKANVKQYVTAQHDALMSSKLGDWIKKNKYDSDVTDATNSLVKSTDSINEKQTFDLWADIDTRVVYKIRAYDTPNSAASYTEYGLNYKGGDDYPFFVSGTSKDSSDSVYLTINSKTNTLNAKLNFKDTSSTGGNFTGDFTFQPTKQAVKITKPTGAMQLSDALSLLGLSDLYNLYLGSASASAATSSSTSSDTSTSASSQAQDAERQSDINSLQTQLEAYWAENGRYPSFTEMNSASWRSSGMPNLDSNALQDPGGSSAQLSRSPASNIYAYSVTKLDSSHSSCESNSLQCQVYTLTATLSNGSVYSKQNIQ